MKPETQKLLLSQETLLYLTASDGKNVLRPAITLPPLCPSCSNASLDRA